MRSLVFVILSAVLILSSCASRTQTKNTSDNVQTAMTLGTNKLGELVNSDGSTKNDEFKTVRVSITGQIILSDKCQFSAMRNHYLIELRRKNSRQTRATKEVGLTESFTYEIDDKINPGDYILNFFYLRKGQLLKTIPLKIDESHDRFTFNVNGCP